MSFRTIEEITREAARLIQARVGQNYQTVQLHEFAQQEMEEIWNEKNFKENLRIDSAVIKTGATVLVLPRKYGRLVGQYGADSAQMFPILYNSLQSAEARLQSLLRGGPTSIWHPQDRGAFNAAFMGDQCVLQQPADALTLAGLTATTEKLSLASTNSNDKSMYVKVIGEDVDGNFVSDLIATNASDGTTAVNTGAAYARVNAISTGATDKVGRFVIIGKDSAKEYCTIEPWATNSQYAAYQLQAAPTTDVTMYYVAKLRFRPFDDSIESPVIYGIDMALVYGICQRAMMEKRQPDLAQFYMSMKTKSIGAALAVNKEPAKLRIRRG